MNVEEGQTFGLELEFTEGMQFDKGYLSPYMVNDAERMEKRSSTTPTSSSPTRSSAASATLLPLLEAGHPGRQAASHRLRGRRGRVARDDRGQQAARHRSRRSPSRRPGSATGASACSRTSRSSPAVRSSPKRWGSSSRTPSCPQLGRARKVVVDKDSTTLIDGAGNAEAIKSRIKQIKAEIETTDSDFDREKLQERLGEALRRGRRGQGRRRDRDGKMKEKKHRVEGRALQGQRGQRSRRESSPVGASRS